MVDTADLKSAFRHGSIGSSPIAGIFLVENLRCGCGEMADTLGLEPKELMLVWVQVPPSVFMYLFIG